VENAQTLKVLHHEKVFINCVVNTNDLIKAIFLRICFQWRWWKIPQNVWICI